MRIHFIRHATFVLETGAGRVLVDPMLGRAGTAPAVPNTPNERPNPLVELPLGDGELSDLLGSTDAVLVTHTHNDHWDGRAQELVPKDAPVLCQPEDEDKISGAGFVGVSPVVSEFEWNGLRFARTGGRHGTGEIGARMAPVSGFVIRAEGSPSLYVAGDTIWCDEVEEALNAHRPDVIVVNAGAARFLEGDPITMTAEDVAKVCRAAPESRVIAVHMEAINHCLLTRRELAEELDRQGLAGRVEIPVDGEILETPS
ncbi:MBL fold metallo-hydrolase [Rubrobacter tropicus]|uniref:MBL fold metallo-hydrolase n=1 Tax=Rubrobacter tropicus TaxID=2653851 RepID=A0A6G8QC56_9ACTN|nr:MBL fold metallo-hydrolase [Rubrobacter tropicus]QIN84001.1 MBL fold metallo-hydrolase [Rubrobacter tropicus]